MNESSSLIASAYPQVPASKEGVYPGSGAKFFDVNAPSNNTVDNLKKKRHEQTVEDRLKHPEHSLREIFFCNYDKDLKEVMREFVRIVLDDKSYHSLISRRFKHQAGWHHYETNRDNALLVICMLTLNDMTKEDVVLLKEITKILLASGIHPLEKCGRMGNTVFAHLLNNREVTTDLLDYFASLHPQAMTDLNEDGGTAMDILLMNNRSTKLVDWVAQNLPHDALQKNLDSIKSRLKKSKKAQYASQLLTTRLEKTMLESGVELISSDNAASNMSSIQSSDINKKSSKVLKIAKI